MTSVFIGIGSNHDALANIERGLALLGDSVSVVAVSPYYKTPSTHDVDVWYINAVAQLETDLSPSDIKALLYDVENKVGRDRTQKDVIALDFDLLIVGDKVEEYEFNGKIYTLPDPDILNYNFVVYPLAQIAPDVQHPKTGQGFAEIAAQFDTDDLIPLE